MNEDRDPRWVIRTARPSELPHVRELLRECALPTEDLDELEDEALAVAVRDGAVIGVAGVELHGPYGLLRSVAVLPTEQGRGLGAALVGDRLRWSAQQRLRAVYLLTDTVPGFFERLGFRAVDRERVPPPVQQSREYAAICPADATVMELALSEPERR